MCNATQIHNLFTLWLYHFDALNIATIHFFMCTQMFLFISFHYISMCLCGWLYESHMRNALSAFVAVNFHAICTICAGNAHIRQIIAYLCVAQSVMRVSLLKFLSVFFCIINYHFTMDCMAAASQTKCAFVALRTAYCARTLQSAMLPHFTCIKLIII